LFDAARAEGLRGVGFGSAPAMLPRVIIALPFKLIFIMPVGGSLVMSFRGG